MPYIGKQPLTGAYQLCDTITTSATATYNLLVGGSAVIPGSANNCIVSLNGVVQAPVSAFTVSGSTITFASTLSATDVIDFILILGNVFDIGTPTNGSVNTSKLATDLTVTHALGSAGSPSITFTGDTNTGIFSPTADTIAFTEGGTEAMRINSSGNVGIGIDPTFTPGGSRRLLQITNGSSGGIISLSNDSNESENPRIFSDADSLGFSTSTTGGGVIQFYTNNTERVLIDATGNFKASRGGAAFNVNSAHQFVDASASNYSLMIANKSASPAAQYMLEISFKSASPDNNTAEFIDCGDSTTTRMRVMSDGDLQNHDNSYGAISDERIKQDIRYSNSQWNDIKNIKIRNYKKKDDVRQYGENAWEQIGVVAQELETVSPKLIKHSDPSPSDILSDASFGTLYQEGDEIPEGKKIGDVKEIYQQVKGVSYSVLYMKAIKALQEAMERIEQLETKNTSLETRLTALENN